MAARAEPYAVSIRGSGRLARVLQDPKAIRLGQRAEFGQGRRVAEDVHGQDSGGVLPHRVRRRIGVEVQRHRVDVDELRRRAFVEEAIGRGDE